MEMTIEEHIAQLKKLKSFHNGSYGASVKVAIDTLRKYQKIEQIINEWSTNMKVNTTMAMCEIEEVVEDDKAD